MYHKLMLKLQSVLVWDTGSGVITLNYGLPLVHEWCPLPPNTDVIICVCRGAKVRDKIKRKK